MQKPSRNDPCSCGSGKKYKRCCLTIHTSIVSDESINTELNRVHQDLILHVESNHQVLLAEQFKVHESPLIKDEETKEIYHTGLTPWMISFVASAEKGETVFEAYVRTHESKWHPTIRRKIHKWARQTPSIYEVISVNTPKKGFLLIEDLQSKEQFDIPFLDQNDFIEGSLLLGMVIPFTTYDNFLFTVVTLYQRDRQYYIDLLIRHAKKDGGLSRRYPQLLAEALSHVSTVHQWEDQRHEVVADLFITHMKQKNVDEQIMMDSIVQWHTYCARRSPIIQKEIVYVAALDYYMQHILLSKEDVKQVEVAKDYGISPSTLSRIYRQMVDELTE